MRGARGRSSVRRARPEQPAHCAVGRTINIHSTIGVGVRGAGLLGHGDLRRKQGEHCKSPHTGQLSINLASRTTQPASAAETTRRAELPALAKKIDENFLNLPFTLPHVRFNRSHGPQPPRN